MKQHSHDLLATAVKLGKQFRILYRKNISQPNFSVITAHMAYSYGGVVCAGAVQILSETLFYLAEYLFCSDGYSQRIETPILVTNQQLSRIVHDNLYNEMIWFIRENVCYRLSYEQDEYGTEVSGSREQLVNDVIRGSSLTLFQVAPFLTPILTSVFPNTLKLDNNSIRAYVSDELAMAFDGIRFSYPKRTSSRLIEEHFDNGETVTSNCNIDGKGCKQTTDRFRQKWFSDSRWVMKYGHDAYGVFGDISDLIGGIKNGHKVRLQIGNISSEPKLLIVNDSQVTAIMVDEFKMKNQIYPFIQTWRMVSTNGMMQILDIDYVTRVPFSLQIVRNYSEHFWYIDKSNWEKVYDSSVKLNNDCRLEKAVRSGSEVRIKWKTAEVDAIFHINEVKYINGKLTASPNEVLPVLDLTFQEFSGINITVDSEIISFRSNGFITRSVWRTAEQKGNVTTYQSQNVTWFALDGLGQL